MKNLKSWKAFESLDQFSQNQKDLLTTIINSRDPDTVKINPDKTISIIGSLDLSYLDLKDFMGLKFNDVTGNFDCSHNKLISLEGSPKKVGGMFFCNNNDLKSLKGCPSEVSGFYCYDNLLESLEYGPQKIKYPGDYRCDINQIKTYKYYPQQLSGKFICDDFVIHELDWNDVDAIIGYYLESALKDENNKTENSIAMLKSLAIPMVNDSLKKNRIRTLEKIAPLLDTEAFKSIEKDIDLSEEDLKFISVRGKFF
jgi:hypothetical protein